MEICPRCFEPLKSGQTCQKCGYSRAKSKRNQYSGVLPYMSTLRNQYVIGDVLGRGGFGITYSAMDTKYSRLCAIKEFMPAEYAERTPQGYSIRPNADSRSKKVFEYCKNRFKGEASVLRSLKGKFNVVEIWDDFEENGTVYLVMEYLKSTVKQLMQEYHGKLPNGMAYIMLLTVASSLMEIHKKNVLHRDITPENIMCPDNGTAGIFKLVDFGSARSYETGPKSVLLKKGYAPPEQYDANGRQGPWTDVYSLCATYYHAVSGKMVPESILRQSYGGSFVPLHQLGCGVSRELSDVITKGLELDPQKRFKDCKELGDALEASKRSVSSHQKPIGNGNPPIPEDGEKKKPPWKRPLIKRQSDDEASSEIITPVNPVRLTPVSAGEKEEDNHTPPDLPPAVPPRPDPPKPVPPKPVPPKPVPPKPPAPKPVPPVPAPPEPAHPEKTAKPTVEILSGTAAGKCMEIPDGQVLKIGRSKLCSDLTLEEDSNVSRLHCVVRFVPGAKRFYVLDLSANGTYYESGQKLPKEKEVGVPPGTKIYLATRKNMLVLKVHLS